MYTSQQKEFWTRDPTDVAKELVGSYIFINDFGHPSAVEYITETRAWNKSLTKRDGLWTQEPGTIGYFPSRGGPILSITAHEKEKQGLVTVTEMILDRTAETIGAAKVCNIVEANTKRNTYVIPGNNELLFMQGLDWKSMGREITTIDRTERNPPNLIGTYRLTFLRKS